MPVKEKKLAAISLLPNGSQLQGVMLPRYDNDHRLIGVLKAKAMTLVDEQTISGDSVNIRFFNPDRSQRGRVDLTHAIFNQTSGMLRADESVTLVSDRVSAQGKGLIYAFEKGEGFLFGPVDTWMQTPTETTMNPPKVPRSTVAASAVGLMLISTPIANAEPPPAADPAAIEASAESKAEVHAAAASASRNNLRVDLESSVATTDAAVKFLEQADIISVNRKPADPNLPENKPLEIKPGPTDTLISCEGGMYFDADAGIFVYLKNVKVTDPRFNLTGANELKIRLGKKPEKAPDPTDAQKQPDADQKKTPGIGLGAKFGDVESIIATGAVKILQKEVEPGKQPVEASGAIFTYHPKQGDITLSGGYPWVMQGATFMRAMEPNLILRIQKSGSFVTEGNWQMGGKIDQKP